MRQLFKNACKAISLVFHPLWMPMAGTYVLLSTSLVMARYPAFLHRTIYLVILSSAVALPLLGAALVGLRGGWRRLAVNTRRERALPLFTVAMFYFFSFYTLERLQTVPMAAAFMLGAAASAALAAVANLWWKISLHAVGLGGLLGLSLGLWALEGHLDTTMLSQILLCGGAAMSARLYLQQHTPAQVAAGYLCGAASVAGAFVIYFM